MLPVVRALGHAEEVDDLKVYIQRPRKKPGDDIASNPKIVNERAATTGSCGVTARSCGRAERGAPE